MRIGHFNHAAFEPGGIATYIRRISKWQAENGHEVMLYSCVGATQDNAAVQSTLEPFIQLHIVRDSTELVAKATQHKLDILHLHAGLEQQSEFFLPTIRTVHGHQPYCPSATRFLKRSAQPCDRLYGMLPCIRGHLLDHCGSMRPKHLLADFQRTRQEQRNLSQTPVICISEYVRQQMLRAGYPEEQLHVLLHAAPASAEYAPPPRTAPPRFVFLGRLTAIKGLAFLLHAFRDVTAPAYLDIAGVGPMESELRRLASQLNVESRVHFHGWMDKEGAQMLLCESRALIFPSIWHEPAGLVTLEAAAMGRAVIGTRVGGLPEYARQNENALLVPSGDVNTLSRAINCLAMDWELAQQLGEQGHRMAKEEFTQEQHGARLLALYQCYAGREAPIVF